MRVLYAKNGGALAVEAEKEASFDFLFQHIEFRCGEELTEGDLKTITKLLNRHDARIFAFIIKDRWLPEEQQIDLLTRSA